jgi:hypothetical protein
VGLALRLVISALLLSVVSVGRRVFSCRERRMGMIANIN